MPPLHQGFPSAFSSAVKIVVYPQEMFHVRGLDSCRSHHHIVDQALVTIAVSGHPQLLKRVAQVGHDPGLRVPALLLHDLRCFVEPPRLLRLSVKRPAASKQDPRVEAQVVDISRSRGGRSERRICRSGQRGLEGGLVSETCVQVGRADVAMVLFHSRSDQVWALLFSKPWLE